MANRNGNHFGTAEIEYAFVRLLGASAWRDDESWDGGFFRRGNSQSFGRLLVKTAAHLEKRVGRLKSPAEDLGDVAARRQLTSAISGLQAIGEGLQEEEDEQPAGSHHWLTIGELVLTIAALLECIEARGDCRF